PHLSPTRQHQPTPFSTLSRLLLLCFGTNSTYTAAPTPPTWLLCLTSAALLRHLLRWHIRQYCSVAAYVDGVLTYI
ncbi:hypothetical protein FN846DRAFT_930767, partial [Sphaerosporella brunnea]